MRVVLLEDVERVGKAGEIVEISDDYAKNVLFPKGLAATATDGRGRVEERAADRVTRKPEEESSHHRVSPRETPEEEFAHLQHIVELVDRKTIHIKTSLGPTGEIENAVTAADIAREIEKTLSTQIPTDAVRLSDPLTELGEQKLTLEFPHGLEAEVTVIVEGTTPHAART